MLKEPTTAPISHPHREFQLWFYSVSHRQLLLRSTKSRSNATRVDILFANVAALSMSTSCTGVTITDADPDLRARIEQETGLTADNLSGSLCFALQSTERVGYVVASTVADSVDHGEFHEASRFELEVGLHLPTA